MTGCGHDHEDGAYVLGALSPEDRVAFERHLPSCPACAQSVRELAGLPGLLARVPIDVFDPERLPTPVPDTLLPALVRRAEQSRNRRRWITGGLVAAALAGGVLVVTTLGGGDDAPPSALPSVSATTAAPRPLTPVGAEPISGWLSLTQVGWGTRLDLTCTYAEDPDAYADPAGTTYLMYVVHTDGTTEQVASWRALPGKTMRLAAATAARAADITDVEVRTSAGSTVLELS